jgi:hypothetical protein
MMGHHILYIFGSYFHEMFNQSARLIYRQAYIPSRSTKRAWTILAEHMKLHTVTYHKYYHN